MKISILLPYKENFSPEYAGAVSLFVKDTTIRSKFKKEITVFGHTEYKKKFSINYINIPFDKKILQSGSKSYVNKFMQLEGENHSDIIEIHNRPNYLEYFYHPLKAKIVLYFHNDPLTMIGSKSKNQRIYLFNKSYKIIFNSEWSKKRFLNGLDKVFYKSEKLIVIYQSTNKVKVNLNKKKNWIIFVGKLNRAKGYDLFGRAVIKILNKFPSWKAIAIGDEPREKLFFSHKNLKKLGFLKHEKVLDIFTKTSIAVACSRWNEPLGRTGLEASSRGCAVIISNRGGLPETITNGIIIKRLNELNVYNSIKKLIENQKYRKILQKLSIKNFMHTHENIVDKIDLYRDVATDSNLPKINYYKKKEKLKILHVTNFNERHDGRLFFNTGRRINNGFIRLNHSVLEFSDRDIISYYRRINDPSGANRLNEKLFNTVYNYVPDIIVLGHADLIKTETIHKIKTNFPNIKICQWFLDRMDGPWQINKRRFLDKIDYTDCNFCTTSPDVLDLPKNRKIKYIPNPVDESFERLNVFSNNYLINDVFFALSHGVHRGVLKKGKFDGRESFINKLLEITPNVKFDLYGINNIQPIWADSFYKVIEKSKMGLNLSQGKPIKYYSSDRITQLVGNGLLTFIDEKTQFGDFFNKDELIFYNSISELSEKIIKYSLDDKERIKVAKKGKYKYFKYFNSSLIAKYIISKTFSNRKIKYLWDKE
jgi:glycosyltransferase involved in cell wall biosynthesis